MVFRHIDQQIKERVLWLHSHAALDDATLSDQERHKCGRKLMC